VAERVGVGGWLKRVAWVCLILLLVLLCYLVWQLSQVVAGVQRSVMALSTNVQRIASEASDVTQRLDAVTEHLDGIEKAVVDFGANKVEGLKDTAAEATHDVLLGRSSMPPAAKEEVAFLLERILESGATFEYEGKGHSGAWMYAKMTAKLVLWRGSVSSAEDFIEKVASKTTQGELYQVVTADGARSELGAWLQRALGDFRAARVPAKAEEEAAPVVR